MGQWVFMGLWVDQDGVEAALGDSTGRVSSSMRRASSRAVGCRSLRLPMAWSTWPVQHAQHGHAECGSLAHE